ncbi:MAG: ComF family protein [Lachnospiraceae bacterium]|nr:ComF family protein [Lachnospiraceae bacterium]
MKAVFRFAGAFLLQLLYPRRCPVCDGIASPFGETVCAECMPVLKPVAAPRCIRCGRGLSSEQALCDACRSGAHLFAGGRSLFAYRSAAPSLYRFKYAGRREYARFYGEEAAYCLGDEIRSWEPDLLVPVPLHPKRRKKRGYNQAAEFAKELSGQLGIPVSENALKRTRNTAPMKLLSPAQRQNNLKKAFIVPGNDVKSKKVLVVDDIYTTGATIDEAARALLEAGAAKVLFVTIAGPGARGTKVQ